MKDLFKNVHSHIFTMDNAPQFFLNLYLPKPVASLVDSATNTQAGAAVLQRLISIFGAQGKRYATFLKIGKSKSQLNVFEELLGQYSDKSMEMVALTLNMDFIGAGLSKSGFEGQLQQVIDIKKQYPDRLLIFLGIDPRWKNSGRELRETVQRYFDTPIESGGKKIHPFAGLKIYPSTGFFVSDPRLDDTFAWAAQNNVPVMTHCYYLGGIFNYSRQAIEQSFNDHNPYAGTAIPKPQFLGKRNIWRWIRGTNESENCKNSCSFFLEPESYRKVLQKYPNLKICFAHFGGADQIREAMQGKPSNPHGALHINWFTQIQGLLATFPNAYADISYDVAEGESESNNFLYNTFYLEANKPYGHKILFGTDYFMTEIQTEEQKTYNKFKNFAGAITLANGNNFWEQVAKHNTNQYLKSTYY